MKEDYENKIHYYNPGDAAPVGFEAPIEVIYQNESGDNKEVKKIIDNQNIQNNENKDQNDNIVTINSVINYKKDDNETTLKDDPLINVGKINDYSFEENENEHENDKIISDKYYDYDKKPKEKCECCCLNSFIKCLCYCFENFVDCICYLFYFKCFRCDMKFTSNAYILILFFIRNLIYFGVFLFFFVNYETFSLKIINYPDYFLISYLIGGFIFLITKLFQCKDNHRGFCVPAVLWFGISIFKFCFYLGIWPIIQNGYYCKYIECDLSSIYLSDDIFEKAAVIYIVYFSFSIIYYLTLTFHLLISHKPKAFLFILFGLFDICIANLVLLYITKNYEIFIYGLIACSYEFIFFNLGFGIYHCLKIEDKKNWLWKALLIEIFSLYPVLLILSIPSVILLLILLCLYFRCCRS